MAILTEEFNTAVVGKNEKFSIELDSLRDPFYNWSLKVKSGAVSLLDVIKPGVTVEGAALSNTFVFKARKTGTVEIEATYMHYNDAAQDEKPKIFTITVV